MESRADRAGVAVQHSWCGAGPRGILEDWWHGSDPARSEDATVPMQKRGNSKTNPSRTDVGFAARGNKVDIQEFMINQLGRSLRSAGEEAGIRILARSSI